MTAAQLNARLLAEQLVPLVGQEWASVADDFELLECHRTFVAGDLLIVRGAAGLAAVEQPSPDERVVRLLSDEAEARRFVAERLEQYERMWDGCGCRADYYCAWRPNGGSASL
ncbi:MAG: hypothetical protein JSW71_20195 [Gemmatimonadota bacterium]|nr:MAG: hypothetical protein JSW71_20195 [Gemmatimonadota bacterium]